MNRIALVILVGLFSFSFGSSADARPPAAAKPNPDLGKILRNTMLTTSPEELEEKARPEFPRVYAVLMDWPVDGETATIFSASNGTASLYTTTTFGIIGGDSMEEARAASIRFVKAADRLFDLAKPVTQFPYPVPGKIRFYLLTFGGVRVLETDLASIEAGTSNYTEYFGLAQAVLTQLQRAPEKAEQARR